MVTMELILDQDLAWQIKEIRMLMTIRQPGRIWDPMHMEQHLEMEEVLISSSIKCLALELLETMAKMPNKCSTMGKSTDILKL